MDANRDKVEWIQKMLKILKLSDNEKKIKTVYKVVNKKLRL